jgi:hypothetical protein
LQRAGGEPGVGALGVGVELVGGELGGDLFEGGVRGGEVVFGVGDLLGECGVGGAVAGGDAGVLAERALSGGERGLCLGLVGFGVGAGRVFDLGGVGLEEGVSSSV